MEHQTLVVFLEPTLTQESGFIHASIDNPTIANPTPTTVSLIEPTRRIVRVEEAAAESNPHLVEFLLPGLAQPAFLAFHLIPLHPNLCQECLGRGTTPLTTIVWNISTIHRHRNRTFAKTFPKAVMERSCLSTKQPTIHPFIHAWSSQKQ